LSYFRPPSDLPLPIVDTLARLSQNADCPFYAPGHKRGKGIPEPLRNLLGERLFAADLPELPELDNLFCPSGAIAEAQALAAETFGAEETFFLVNGSTSGIIAAVLATCNPDDRLLLPRNLHQSAIAGLIHSGAIPAFIQPDYNAEWDLTLGVSAGQLEAALNQYPDVKAILLVCPTYQGVGGDLEGCIQLARDRGLPVIVDEAHGAHFAFHPALPPPALSLGADLVVQSTHKTLGAMSQASMLHVRGTRVDRDRLRQALQSIQSTSPSYLLLASLDGARHQMASRGQELMDRTLALARDAREYLSQLAGLEILEVGRLGVKCLDATRLTVRTAGLGLTGFEVDERLRRQWQVTAELPLPQHLTFMITLGNDCADIDRLVGAFTALSQERSPTALAIPPAFVPAPTPLRLSPRQAFFASKQAVPGEQAIGEISAELLCPYPPGIPVLIPGEEITAEAIAYLRQVAAWGGTIAGSSDPTLSQFKIIARNS
jgi:lysine decarboxylase